MKKLISKLRGKRNKENLINGIIEASKTFPNDMTFGRCMRLFMFECTEHEVVDDEKMYQIMQECIDYVKVKNNQL